MYDSEVKAILEILSRETIKHVGLKLVFLAVVNSFESVLVEQGIKAHALFNFSTVAIRFFSNLFTPVLKRMKKDFCTDNHNKIFKFFK